MQKARGKKKSSKSKSVALIPKPPPYQSSIQVAQTFRFQATSAFSGLSISLTALFSILNVATSATTATQLFQSLKFKKIRMWGPPAQALTPVTVSVEFPGNGAGAGLSGPLRVWSDTSIGSTECAFVERKPAPGSYQSLWQSPVNIPFMIISGPTGTIVDIHVVGVLLLNGGVNAVSAPAAATTGQVYLRGLDGLVAATTVLPPVSYPTD